MNEKKTKESRQQEILIVDDTPASLQFLTSILSGHGYRVRPASDGSIALRSVAAELPDIILLDVKMPDMDGYEVCRRLKSDDRSRKVPVIFISALGETIEKVEGFKAGGVDYITKPFDPEEVLARVKIHLQLQELTYSLERKVHEQTEKLTIANKQLKKANEAYKALSECNQALVRATNEADLLQQICRIIAQDCGYHLVWIGFAEHDEAKTVRPVVQAGYEQGYLDTINITWADTELGRGPTGTAIREKTPVINKDILTNPDFAPWKDEAIKRGYASSAAVPLLTSEQEAIGALNVYASEPDAFTAEEISLLSELANDLTYGLVSLRVRAERQRAEKVLSWEAGVNQAAAELSRNLLLPASIDDISLLVLEHAKRLTCSAFGYVGHIDPETGYLVCPTLTKNIWDTCQVAEKDIVFKKFTGLWGWVLKKRRSLLTNAVVDDPRSSGTPPGHISIHRFLSVPAMIGETLVGQLSVANADHDYTERELEVVERFANLYAIALQRQKAEQELEKHREHLEELVRERTAELEISRNKAQQYLDVAGVILVAVDAERRVTLINQKGCEILGGATGEIIGKDWFETFIPPNIRQDIIQTFHRLMAGEIEPVEYFENPVLTLDGQKRFIAWHNALLRDGEGNIVGTLSSGEDITERKHAESEIRRLNQNLHVRAVALEAKNKELEGFVYSISHDLRAPLRHIDGFMDLLQKRTTTALDDHSRHYMDAVADSAKRMGTLIDDLLSFSRMGRHAISFQKVALEELMRDIICEFEPDTAGRNIDWCIGNLPVVSGDKAMLRVVLVNLISNALKFTRPRQQAKIEIGSQPGQNSETMIFVRDNGVGFDMTYADKLFGVFHRLHSTDEFEGTGIGLANVHRIIARHGGRIWAESKLDQGAVFYFTLPQA